MCSTVNKIFHEYNKLTFSQLNLKWPLREIDVNNRKQMFVNETMSQARSTLRILS